MIHALCCLSGVSLRKRRSAVFEALDHAEMDDHSADMLINDVYSDSLAHDSLTHMRHSIKKRQANAGQSRFVVVAPPSRRPTQSVSLTIVVT